MTRFYYGVESESWKKARWRAWRGCVLLKIGIMSHFDTLKVEFTL